jgi:hypothetical protein
MELVEVWLSFAERMAEIELFQRAAKNLTEKELKFVTEYSDYLKENPKLKNSPESFHNMSFINARTGETKFYNFKKLSIEKRYLHVLLHKNKQYKWLLVEAYEEFNDYLENICAYYEGINEAFEKAKKGKDTPKSILERFRIHFPRLQAVESKNKLQVNLYLAITLIAELRHVIVHEGGIVSSKKDFIKKTTMKCDLYNNGNISQNYINFINQFFGKNDYKNLITLLEIKIKNEIIYDINIYPFDVLIDYLMSYAYLIYEHINSSINRQKT